MAKDPEARERRRQRKEEVRLREQAARQRARRTRLIRRFGAYAIGVGLVAGLGYWAYAKLTTPPPGQVVPGQGNAHIPAIWSPHPPYNTDPPTSGWHVDPIAPWGIHATPIPKELQVHNLEDGGVAVQYNCPQGCPELVKQLESIVKRYDKHVLLAPYPGMDRRIALTAWRRIDKFDDFDEARIERFIKSYKGIDHHVR
jgi:hypothetical protein